MEKMRQGQTPTDNFYGQQNQGVGSRRGLSGSSKGLNHSMSVASNKSRPSSKVGLRQQIPDIPGAKSSSRRSNASGTRAKRGSVKKDNQTLTLMPVDQSLMNRRKSGTIDDDMVCFSPSNLDAAVCLNQVNSRGGPNTHSIDRSQQHVLMTQNLTKDLEAQLMEEVSMLEKEDELWRIKVEADAKA
jgi:hypothetical protein